MAIVKLTPPQAELLLELAQQFRMTVATYYPPAKALVARGFAKFENDRIVLTDEGSEHAVKLRSIPVPGMRD